MGRMMLTLGPLLAAASLAHAAPNKLSKRLDNGLALTPPMGVRIHAYTACHKRSRAVPQLVARDMNLHKAIC